MIRVSSRTVCGGLALAAILSCSDSTGGVGVPAGSLTFLRLAPTAPALCADSAGAKFGKDPNGQDQWIELVFPLNADPLNCGLGQTEVFLRLSLKKTSLLRYPDGNLVADGDSVFISVKWVGSDSILFRMEPSGLQFSTSEPARLLIDYREAGADLNEDGTTDSLDTEVEHQLDVWRQAKPGGLFYRTGTGKDENLDEIQADLLGFSRYAIAY